MSSTRPRLRDRCSDPYDLIVVGGGINGVGTAREAAGRGLRVLLVEQGDFAFGASSRSTKLIHGGLRYLEHGDFGLVAEALKERRVLCDVLAPHLTRPLPFLVPVYAGDARPAWMVRAGLTLYDTLAVMGRSLIRRHRWLGPRGVGPLAPGLAVEGLRGAAEYWDCQMDDARLALETLADAVLLGAQAMNYCSLEGALRLRDGDVRVTLRDRESAEVCEARGRLLVLAAGAWTDRAFDLLGLKAAAPRVHPTKGIHLVTRRLLDTHALLIPARADGRLFFVIPWSVEGRPASLIGTTDTDDGSDPASPRAEGRDIAYLLAETARVLPGAGLREDDVWATFAGLRPLSAPGRPTSGNSAVSREHVFWEEPGVLAVTGGKYTTYRSLCQSLVARAAQRLRAVLSAPFSDRRPLPGAPRPGEESGPDLVEAIVRASGLASAAAELLVGHYGRQARDVAALCLEDPRFALPVAPGSASPAILAMAVWAARREHMVHLDDFYLRRTRLGLLLGGDHAGAEELDAVVGRELGWDEGRRAGERSRLRDLLAREYR